MITWVIQSPSTVLMMELHSEQKQLNFNPDKPSIVGMIEMLLHQAKTEIHVLYLIIFGNALESNQHTTSFHS